MSQHSQRTQFGPSRASVATTGVLVGLSALATGYVTSGPWDARQIVATVLGVGLTTLLLARVFSLMAERAVIADRAEREAERAEREYRTGLEDGKVRELEAWQNAAAGLLDAYLTGRAVDFGGEPVPDYVRTRLADLAPPPVSQPEPPVDEGPVVYPPQPDVDQTRTWLAEVAARYAEPVYEDPLGYQADPERPWRAFEPRHEDRMAEPGESGRVAVPLPPREVPVSPGRGWHGDETEVIPRVRDEGQTQVIPAQS